MFARNMKFSVGAGFAVVLGLMVALTLIGLKQMAAINDRLERIVKDNNVKTELATVMRDSLRERALNMHTVVVLSDLFEQDEELQRFYAHGVQFTKARQSLDQMVSTAQERAILSKIQRHTEITQPLVLKTIELAQDHKNREALQVLRIFSCGDRHGHHSDLGAEPSLIFFSSQPGLVPALAFSVLGVQRFS